MNANTRREVMLRCIASELKQPIPGFAKLTHKEILEEVGNRRLRGLDHPPPKRGLFDEDAMRQTDLIDWLMESK